MANEGFTHNDWEMARHWRDNYAHAACHAVLDGNILTARENAGKYMEMVERMAEIQKALEHVEG